MHGTCTNFYQSQHQAWSLSILVPPFEAVLWTCALQEDPAASAAVAATMDQLDFNKLLQQVDSGYRSWRKPSLLLFGANDPFVDVKNPFAFLDDKRTNMRLVTASAKVRSSLLGQLLSATLRFATRPCALWRQILPALATLEAAMSVLEWRTNGTACHAGWTCSRKGGSHAAKQPPLLSTPQYQLVFTHAGKRPLSRCVYTV